MADDNEPRYFSPKNAKKGAPKRAPQMTESDQTERLTDPGPGSRAQRTTTKDNRSLFIEAMAETTRRRIAFDVVERNCRMRFRVGEHGIRVYLQVLELVQLSKVDEAVDEFEKRFLPMLDQEMLKRMIEEAR